MLIDHSGRSYLVTGAGSGIGQATAIQLAASGATVWVVDLNLVAAAGTAAQIKDAGGVAQAIQGDAANPTAWFAAVAEQGPLHGIMHNAGYDLATPIATAQRSDFERLLAVMVTGPYELTQLLLPNLKAAGGACILFTASVHALATEPQTSAYAACKAAQIGMMRSLIQDLGPYRVRVVAIAPGYIDTPLLGTFFDNERDPEAARAHAASLHPLGRIGCPADIASAVTFLLSPAAEFINGTTLVVDGGLTAQLHR